MEPIEEMMSHYASKSWQSSSARSAFSTPLGFETGSAEQSSNHSLLLDHPVKRGPTPPSAPSRCETVKFEGTIRLAGSH
jgi:hypothetical protein